MIGQTLGRYLILEQIGAGGMGIVYRSRDERLNRDVALKVLPAGKLSDDDSRKRFRREALALAKLNHPNIGTVYDFDSQNNVDFLVMEYIHGETLKDRLAQTSLAEKDVVGLGVQIASALEEAHEHGVVHRDLKPGNIMVTPKGQAKVLDFGLARLLDVKGEAEVTQTITQTDAAGTLPYMSPEQLRGETVDARSDVFAAGVLLYEMSAGHRPFQERQSARLIQQILTEAPPSPREVNQRLTPQLEGIILKALDKEPNLRYQSARELRVDLERLGVLQTSTSAVAASRQIGSLGRVRSKMRAHRRVIYLSALVFFLAVASLWWYAGTRPVLSFAPRDWILLTDFDNQTGDPLFDRSLLTALTVSLEQSSHANVLPRARIADGLRRMGKTGEERINEDLGREISEREHVRAVLSCAIARVGQQYALTVRMIDPHTGSAVRSYLERANGQESVLPALDKIASRVRRDLGESLSSIQMSDRPLPQVTTGSIQALKQYADASALWSKGKYTESVQLDKNAVQLDSDFSMAHAALGNAYYSFIFNAPEAGKVEYEKALQLSSRTTERERLSIEVGYASAQKHVREAINLYHVYLDKYPDDWRMRSNFASELRTSEQYQDAIEQYLEVLRIAPKDAGARINLATAYTDLGKVQDALSSYNQAFELEPSWKTSSNLNHEYGFALVRNGDEAGAKNVFELALEKPDMKGPVQRSLGWLSLYDGQYRNAKNLFEAALLFYKAKNSLLSMARQNVLLSIVADGQGDRLSTLHQLDEAAKLLPSLGPKVWMGSLIGCSYARAGAPEKAKQLLQFIKPLIDVNSQEQSSQYHRLEGEVALAQGKKSQAIELLSLAQNEKSGTQTIEALARSYAAAGDLEQTIAWYQTLVETTPLPLGWEPQQDWLAAHYLLAKAYSSRGAKDKAGPILGKLLTLWKDADPGLPLLKEALALKHELEKKP